MKKTNPKIIYLAMSLLCSLFLSAQNQDLKFNQLTKDNGLSSNRITCFYQDKIGFLWIGTYYGLNRYDGYSFKSFYYENDSSGISDNNVLCITEDADSNLWIGTFNGLSYYNRKKDLFSHFRNDTTKKGTISNNRILSLAVDGKELLWVGTDNGLNKFHINTQTNLRTYTSDAPNELKHSTIFSILAAKEAIWIGNRFGLDRLDKLNKQITHSPAEFDFRRPITIAADKNDLWVATRYSGVYKLVNKQFDQITTYNLKQEETKSNWISELTITKNGIHHLAMSYEGFISFHPGNLTASEYLPKKYDDKSLSSKSLTAIHVTRDNTIWLGTYNKGINYIDTHKNKFQHYKMNHSPGGLFNDNIRALFEDSEENLWIGTKEEGGLSKLDRETGEFSHYKATKEEGKGINNDFICAINELHNRYILIGTHGGGLNILDKKTGNISHHLHNSKKTISSRKIYAIHIDQAENIWIATLADICVFNFQNKTFREIPISGWVKTFTDENDSLVWMGTSDEGLVLYNTNKEQVVSRFTHNINKPESICSNEITSICKDQRNNLWIGTSNGLCVLDGSRETFKTFTLKNGLPSNHICKILRDDYNNIWVSTYNGISCYNQKTQQFRNYDRRDGLQGNEFADYVGAKTKSGELAFGGVNGFNLFSPGEIKDNHTFPKIVFTDFQLFNKSVAAGASNLILSQHISLTKTLALKHQQNVFSIEFVALNYSSAKKNKFAYLMEGFEPEWNYVGEKRKATYTNLNPGKYTFRVKVSNSEGIWSENEAKLTISILPPFWKTWWFRILLTGIMFGAFIGIYHIRVANLRRQKKVLEQTVRQRTAKLHEAYNKLVEHKDEIELRNFNLEKKTSLLQKLNLNFKPGHAATNNNDEEFLKKVIEYVWENMYDSQLSVSKLGKVTGTSVGNLYRKIYKLTNLSPSNFIRDLRLKRAAQLITNTQLRISEIQDMVGYESKSAFSSAFKKQFSCTPSEYLHQERKKS